MPRFPPPCDEAFYLSNGKATPVESIPKKEWDEIRKRMMESVGKTMSDYIARKA